MAATFITGTGTGIGKTAITALIARQLRAAGHEPSVLKPVLSGFDPLHPELSDAGILLSATGQQATPANLDAVSPWRFAAPLSPDMAAAREDRVLDFKALIAHCRNAIRESGLSLIEGVGGAMVPLDEKHTVLDWMAAIGCPAIVVSGTYLGAISHCLTTVTAIRSRALPIRAIVLNTSVDSPVPPEETAAVIARFTGLPVHIVPRLLIDGQGLPALAGAPDLTALAL